MVRRIILIVLSFIIISKYSFSQSIDTTAFKITTRLSFYTSEKNAEVLLTIPRNHIYDNLTIILKVNNNLVSRWEGRAGSKSVRITFPIDLPPASHKISADISIRGTRTRYMASGNLVILEYKANEVKTDRLTGGLIVNKRDFFPFGFYCYSPVHPTLPEEEVVRGFNMISPYQKILPQTFAERKSYMDRCAELGMKVHYNLLSVTGGGGVGSKTEVLTAEEKMEILLNEIDAIKDHPALLAWYIADEPNGNNITPDSLIRIYRIIKKADPWHPVSIVFMAPFMSSKRYADGLDIVMADPYPVPDSPVSMVGNVAASLYSEFKVKKPVWIVPQAFGGGEWWGREPTLQEIRTMTYQSIINGARGIQYFIRQGPNLFPKSTSTWGECGRIATEIAELTPWLLSDEESIPVMSENQNIIITSATHDGQLMIMAANRTNNPQTTGYAVSNQYSGKARVVFENRKIAVIGGYFTDHLSAYGTQVYLIDLKTVVDSVKSRRDNLLKDPGFEDIASPGVPASCYARNGGDRGATYFLDSREHIEGNHSIRLVTPKDNAGIKLRFFPVSVMNGRTYFISVRAKTDPEQGRGTNSGIDIPHFFEISLGDHGGTRFVLTGDWKEYVTNVTIPYYNDLPPRTNIILQMPSAGVAWFDMLQITEGIDIKQCINPELRWNGY